MIRTTEESFWQRVDKTDSCWNWKGSLNNKGYGMVSFKGRGWFAHRLSLVFSGIELQEGLVCDHLCRNPACVNPSHIEQTTKHENTPRGIGISAVNARKTHCIRGHELTAENTMICRKQRKCRACDRLRQRSYYLSKRELEK